MTNRNHRRNAPASPTAPNQTRQMEDRHQELIDALDKLEDSVTDARSILSDNNLSLKNKCARVGVALLRATIKSGQVVR